MQGSGFSLKFGTWCVQYFKEAVKYRMPDAYSSTRIERLWTNSAVDMTIALPFSFNFFLRTPAHLNCGAKRIYRFIDAAQNESP